MDMDFKENPLGGRRNSSFMKSALHHCLIETKHSNVVGHGNWAQGNGVSV